MNYDDDEKPVSIIDDEIEVNETLLEENHLYPLTYRGNQYYVRKSNGAVENVGELRFTTVKESVNIYEIQKFFILIATRVDRIFITNKKDSTNNPIIRYTSHNGLSSVDKEMLYTQQTPPLT